MGTSKVGSSLLFTLHETNAGQLKEGIGTLPGMGLSLQIFPTTASFGGVNIIVNSNYKLFKYFTERSIIVFICGFFD